MALQDGIYYNDNLKPGNSVSILFLRAMKNIEAKEVGIVLKQVWNSLKELERGIVKDLDIDPYKRYTGNLSVLVGYGPKVFELNGIRRPKPQEFESKWMFNAPDSNGGGPITNSSKILYSNKLFENHALKDHIIFQFIADHEFYTSRALVETWKTLHRLSKESKSEVPLIISRFYTGFRSPNMRNWLGFLDGVSNMKSSERLYSIALSSDDLRPQDYWLINGTYMGFMRIALNLEAWEDIEIEKQEIMIGRDKETGCPLIGVDEDNRPIKDSRCPVIGTHEVTDAGNEYFRDHPPYRHQYLPPGVSDEVLDYSHIGTTRQLRQSTGPKLLRIFRQGFEFLESINEEPGLMGGLNFISFQNRLQSLFEGLTYVPNEEQPKDRTQPSIPRLDVFQSVLAAGIFLVPPYQKTEPFPGSTMFFDSVGLEL